jgi:lipopolysaccharide heptosyltransferase I
MALSSSDFRIEEITSAFKAIAIIRLSALGDIIHAFPVANILKREYPASRISWIVDTRYQDILEEHPDIDEIIPVDTRKWKEGIKGTKALIGDVRNLFRVLKNRRFSLSLDLQGLIKSGIFSAMTQAERKVGFDMDNCRESLNTFFTDTCITPKEEDTHIIDKNLSLLRGLGINTEGWKWQVPVKSDHEKRIKGFLTKPEINFPLVGINPGAGWVTKRWGAERFSLLADRLIDELDATVIWTWGPGEKPLVEEIRQRMKTESLVAPPTTVLELAALFRHLDLFVGGDTGPLHLAVASGTPTVSIFGPTDPERNGPYGPGHHVLYQALDCSGCHKRTCNNFHCLDPITPDKVFQACRQQLEAGVQLNRVKEEKKVNSN